MKRDTQTTPASKSEASGFLVSSWTPELAELLAVQLGLETLEERHWRVISVCREETARRQRMPSLERLADRVGLERREVDRLFRPDPAALVAHIAGVCDSRFPAPTRCTPPDYVVRDNPPDTEIAR